MTTATIRCPVCQADGGRVFCNRKHVPVHQNYLLPDADSARGIARGHLRMTCCRQCGFVFNDAFDADLLDYGANYDNTQLHSPAFEEYVDGLVDRVLATTDNDGTRFVEVGCGKGAFLKKLVSRAGPAATGVGFDPTYVGPLELFDGRLQFRHRFYDADAAGTPADVVVCRHVIEHVPRPLDLLRSVRHALRGSPTASVFFETPCIEWILSRRVVWDLFYEHCSLFTAQSLGLAFQASGFQVLNIDHVFGGQYLWIEARCGETETTPTHQESPIVSLAERFREFETAALHDWGQRLAEWNRQSTVALWGAGAKGVTLANLIDPEGRRLNCLVDVNPGKQGHFLPGTGHPIVAPDRLIPRQVGIVGVTNPNYLDEITQLVENLSSDIRTLDLMQGM